MSRFKTHLQRIILFLALFVGCTQAAPAQDGVWAHTFEGTRTTYLELEGELLIVWQYLHRTGDCMAYPSRVERDGNRVEHRGGTTWHLRPGTDTMAVQMPSKDTTITYHRTHLDPRRFCLKTDESI